MRSRGNNSRCPFITSVLDLFLTLVMITLTTGAMQYLQHQSQAEVPPRKGSPEAWGGSVQSLQERYQDLLRELQRLPSADQLRDADLKALEAARQRIKQELEALRQDITRIEEALQKLRQQGGQVDEGHKRLLEELSRLRQQIEALEGKLRNAQQAQEQIDQLRKQLEELLRRLNEARKKRQDLQEKIAEEKAKQAKPAVTIQVHPRFQPRPDLRLKLVVISQATVTPVCEPYYRPVYEDFPGFRRLVGFHFARPGRDVAEALREGSDFVTWLSKIDPKKEYAFVLVDSASFDTFRAVRAELRKREILWGWEPDERGNENIRFRPEGGGISTGTL